MKPKTKNKPSPKTLKFPFTDDALNAHELWHKLVREGNYKKLPTLEECLKVVKKQSNH